MLIECMEWWGEGIAYRGVDLDGEQFGFAALGVYELVFGRFLLLQEDTESTGDTLDAEEIVSGMALASKMHAI